MPINSLKELKPNDFDYWSANHLMNRAGFGGTPAQIREHHQLGLEAAVEDLVEYHKIDAPPISADQFDKSIMRAPTEREQMMIRQARRSGDEDLREQLQRERQRRQMADREQLREMQRWWLQRMMDTPRSLEEKMTLFWHGHFASSYRGTEDSYHMFMQNNFFRTNATGNFADLVNGIIRDPAMLRFLNNNQNRRQSPNENLARELMELFTLGEGNGYTEDDIKQGARALTGYTFDDDQFVFQREAHDGGVKRIFSQTGKFDGADFCRLILAQNACSEYICWKLYRYFVNDVPDKPDKDTKGFVLKLAKVFRDKKYEIKPVLKTLFKSEHFYDAANRASVIKNPIQLMVQTTRSLGTPSRNLTTLVNAADLMGQNLFVPPSVKGWDGGRAWINTSTMFVRQNTVLFLLTGRRPDAATERRDSRDAFDARHLIEDLNSGNSELKATIAGLLRFCLGVPPHPSRIESLVTFVNQAGGKLDNATLIRLLALIAAMPEYQLC